MDQRWMYGLGGAALGAVAVAIYYSQTDKPSGSKYDAQDQLLVELMDKVRVKSANADEAWERSDGMTTAMDWIVGQQKLGYVVGYTRQNDNELRLKRFVDKAALKATVYLPVPTILDVKTSGYYG